MAISSLGSFFPQTNFQQGLAASPFTSATPTFAPAGGPAMIMQMLQQLMGALSQLSQNWGGLLGGEANPYGTAFNPYGAEANPYGAASNPYGVVATSTGYGGAISSGGVAVPFPVDGGDFNSYLTAQLAGGALQGQTTVRQSDGVPGTRFASVQDPTLWHANVGRQYAYQFAAFASGNDPLSAQGLVAGAQAMNQMSPDAQLFTQVASVFKGNLFQGPGFYDNAGLKNLLQQRGLTDLASLDGVGQTDVQTIGAVTAALNRGQLTLQDILQSGTIDNLDRYGQVIQYIQSGQFAQNLQAYDSVPV